MKPTNEDAPNRRDGWFEHRGVWDEVRVGTVLASRKRTERWEIIATSHGKQIDYGETLWMRARDQVSGKEFSIPPRVKTLPVTILTQDPADRFTGEHTEPSDTQAILLLVEQLGAKLLARRDEITGEITCPDYSSGHNHLEHGPGQLRKGELEHLQFAHNLTVEPDIDLSVLTHLHAQAHDSRWPNIGKGGFPHRHVPEDLSFL